jgi:Na+-transporting NADH:ubiquinone oxidoreductase subunit B
MGLFKLFKKIEPDKKKYPFLHTLYDGFFTFAFVPDSTTKDGVHIRDGMDLKRLMTFVVLAMIPAYLFGIYNIGHQHFVAMDMYTGWWDGANLKIAYGLIKLIPILVVSMVVGLGIEFYFAYRKGHGIEEGFLVSGTLIPLIMPPDIPLWILALAIVFAVIIGKEAFGGTGMNIWNIALLSRLFVFFAYPLSISGDQVWVAGFEALKEGTAVSYGWWETGFFNTLFDWFNWPQFDPSGVIMDGYSGATALSLAFEGGWDAVLAAYPGGANDLLWGTIPGSIGETSKPLILLGALLLLVTKVGSWRIMLSAVLGAVFMGIILNLWGATPLMEVPWYYQFHLGSALFAIVFMATDPVTASSTNTGKWIYGALIGIIGMIVRVMNPAYPEGWMLAIIFMNTFAPLIDHYIIQNHIKKRLKSA